MKYPIPLEAQRRPARPTPVCTPVQARNGWRLGLLGLLGGLALAAACSTASAATYSMRVVGGLAGVDQYRKFEEPFWTQQLPRLTEGQASASIVPFDQAGIRNHEVLRLVQTGAVPFATMLLSGLAASDPELQAVDLAGLNPDMATLKAVTQAWRPHLVQVMRERYGIEVLAIYVYPAQVTFCAKAFKGLSDLAGRRVRISNPTQADLIRPFGAVPVQLPFAQMVEHVRAGNVDCAITGAMSGNAIGLHQVTTHLDGNATTWGLSLFGANLAAWQAVPEAIKTVLTTHLPRLEQAIWADAEQQMRRGVACNTGQPDCVGGTRGQMVEVKPTPQDAQRLKEAFRTSVLPAWVARCGNACVPVWNQILAPVTGIQAQTQPTKPNTKP